jgi:hypothetical protein
LLKANLWLCFGFFYLLKRLAGHQWLTQEAEIKRIKVQIQPRKIVRPYLKKTHHKKELMEWLKV